MRMYHNNLLTVSNTKFLNYICGNFTFEALNLHREKSTLEKIVPQGLIRNTELQTYKYTSVYSCLYAASSLRMLASSYHHLLC